MSDSGHWSDLFSKARLTLRNPFELRNKPPILGSKVALPGCATYCHPWMTLPLARKPPAASSQTVRPVRVARFPRNRGQNPYLGLLDEALSSFGVELGAEPPFTLSWLWRARREIHVLHFHWRPDFYYAWCRPAAYSRDPPPAALQGLGSWITLVLFGVRLAAARLLGYRLMWTVHEIYPPENNNRPPGSISRRIDRLGGRLLARVSDVLYAHDSATAERAREELGRPAKGIEVVPHGSFIGVYPAGRPRLAVKAELRIADDAFTFLCFGQLRPDKSVKLLLEAFCSTEDPHLALVVAGQVLDDRSRDALVEAAASDSRIRLLLETVSAERVRELFDASDALVLARSEAWTSGSLILALSLGLPVVAARLSPYEELLDAGRAGWLFRPGDADSLRAALLQAAADPGLGAKRAAALQQGERLPRWSEIAAQLAPRILQTLEAGNGRGWRVGRRAALPPIRVDEGSRSRSALGDRETCRPVERESFR